MKINIQNLANNLVELDDAAESDFLPERYRSYYPDPLKIHAVVDKFGSDIRFTIQLTTEAEYRCDRCLSAYRTPFEARMTQIVQIGEGKLKDEEDIALYPVGATEIDIDPFLMEMIILNHPVKMLCRDDCKGICPGCGADLNHEPCRCGTEKVDPRWEELKKFIK